MRKTWMISTACAAVLAMSGMAAAQGMNEQGGGKNAPAAAQHEGQAPSHMNQGQPGRAGATQNMERGGAKGQNAQGGKNDRAGAKETTGQGMSSEPGRKSAGERDRAEPKASERTHQQNSGAAVKDRDEKSGSAMKERDEKSGSAMKERNEKSGAASTNERNNTRTGANQNGRSTTGAASSKEVKLTTEQRTKIRKVVVDEHKIPRLSKVDFNIRVGVKVPRTVHFVAVPEEIIAIYPAWRAYRVIFVNNELVLIDPATYEIVDVVVV